MSRSTCRKNIFTTPLSIRVARWIANAGAADAKEEKRWMRAPHKVKPKKIMETLTVARVLRPQARVLLRGHASALGLARPRRRRRRRQRLPLGLHLLLGRLQPQRVRRRSLTRELERRRLQTTRTMLVNPHSPHRTHSLLNFSFKQRVQCHIIS